MIKACDLTASEVIRHLRLAPHPEGGHFRETFRDTRTSPTGRATSTAIYYLLARDEASRWHKVDATEVWHWYAGDALELLTAPDASKPPVANTLGPSLFEGQEPQLVVPAHHWQQARTLGAWTLVGCTVAPGFEFAGFEMAPPDFVPGKP